MILSQYDFKFILEAVAVFFDGISKKGDEVVGSMGFL